MWKTIFIKGFPMKQTRLKNQKKKKIPSGLSQKN